MQPMHTPEPVGQADPTPAPANAVPAPPPPAEDGALVESTAEVPALHGGPSVAVASPADAIAGQAPAMPTDADITEPVGVADVVEAMADEPVDDLDTPLAAAEDEVPLKLEAPPDPEAAASPTAEAEVQVEVQAQADPQAEADEPEAEAEPQTVPDAEAEAATEPAAWAEPEPEVETEPEAEAWFAADAAPEPVAEPVAEAGGEPDFVTERPPVAEAAAEPAGESDAVVAERETEFQPVAGAVEAVPESNPDAADTTLDAAPDVETLPGAERVGDDSSEAAIADAVDDAVLEALVGQDAEEAEPDPPPQPAEAGAAADTDASGVGGAEGAEESDVVAAVASLVPLRPGELATSRISLWTDQTADELRARLRAAEPRFFDDPAAAVVDAQRVVTDAVNALAATLSAALLHEQDAIDPRRSAESPDTEALRLAMRGYRDFLERLLAL